MSDATGLLSAAGALKRLGEPLRRREVPFVAQNTIADCGPASLAMVLELHGREVRLDQLREAMSIDRGGTSARDLLRTASLFGLRGRGVRIEVAALPELPLGTILHWELKHFVVFERVVAG